MDEQLLDILSSRIPCREEQITQLTSLLDPSIPNSSAIVLHGTTATAKSLTVRAVLSSLGTPHAIIESRECITGRHLLERTLASVHASLSAHSLLPSSSGIGEVNARVESLSALTSQLSVLLSSSSAPVAASNDDANKADRFVLVFDGVDKQREAPATLLPALARLGEVIPSLTVILVVTSPRARYLHRPGVPHIQFTAYTRDESIEVLRGGQGDGDGFNGDGYPSWRPPNIYFDDPSEALGTLASDAAGNNSTDQDPDELRRRRAEDNDFLWTRFVGAVWDSLGKGAARDLIALRGLCERLWPAFVTPVRKGEYAAREFARLMVRNRALFQSEAGLHEGLLAPATLVEADFDSWRTGGGKKTSAASNATATATATATGAVAARKGAHELPYYGKFLLVAAFIASHNPARTDAVLFMKMHEKKRKKISGAGYRGPGRPPKHRKGITRKLLGPQPFAMERWLAIFYAIVPGDDDDGDGDATGAVGNNALTGSADLLTQVATLAALRLIVRTSLSSNIMDASTKWRANIGLEYAQTLAKQVRFDVADYLTEG